MGVCCIVFDIDGMLFEFFKYWKKYFYFYIFFNISCFLIVFDIDGMLFEFFMNFLNIEKNKILRIFFFAFHAISNINKKIKKSGGGGGGCWIFF